MFLIGIIGEKIMRKSSIRSITTICFVCTAMILMCAFFVDEVHAAKTISGTTSKKEQTVKVKLSKGTSMITVQDTDSWVFAQLQTSGGNKIGTAVNGDNFVADLGQKGSFTVPVKTAGTYYLYLHGENSGATYTIKQYAPSGTLKSGKPKTGTSYADNTSVSYYKIKVPSTGILQVAATDASIRYPGYSKVQLMKGKTTVSGEEHLIKGLGFTTTYGVSKGTYKIGVRSSSELYKITATFRKTGQSAFGKSKKSATPMDREKTYVGVIEAGSKAAKWHKFDIPSKASSKNGAGKRVLTISSQNNNFNLEGGIKFVFVFKKTVDKKEKKVTEAHVLSSDTQSYTFSAWKKKKRTVYVKVIGQDANGSYSLSWK